MSISPLQNKDLSLSLSRFRTWRGLEEMLFSDGPDSFGNKGLRGNINMIFMSGTQP